MLTTSKVRRQMLRGTYRPIADERAPARGLSGAEIRAGYGQRIDWEARIVEYLRAHGPSVTRVLQSEGLRGGMKHSALVRALAEMVDAGVVVAARTDRGKAGRPGTVWTLV